MKRVRRVRNRGRSTYVRTGSTIAEIRWLDDRLDVVEGIVPVIIAKIAQ